MTFTFDTVSNIIFEPGATARSLGFK